MTSRMTNRAQLGMKIFLIADAVLFFLLILAFLMFRRTANMSLTAGSLDTALLLISVIAMWRAVSGARRWVVITILLGAAFLIGQAHEYLNLVRDSATITHGLFGTAYFTLTAVHALHVIAALVAIGLVPHSALPAAAIFWYLLAAVWLAVFIVVYLAP